MGVRAILYPAVMVLVPAVWLLAGRPAPYPFLADTLLGIPFAFDAAGNVPGLFANRGVRRHPALDRMVLALDRIRALARVRRRDRRAWEICEYLLMRSGASRLDLTYDNTIQDLAMSLTVAVAGALVVATILWPAAGTPATLFGWR
jgi:hypothetical protein